MKKNILLAVSAILLLNACSADEPIVPKNTQRDEPTTVTPPAKPADPPAKPADPPAEKPSFGEPAAAALALPQSNGKTNVLLFNFTEQDNARAVPQNERLQGYLTNAAWNANLLMVSVFIPKNILELHNQDGRALHRNHGFPALPALCVNNVLVDRDATPEAAIMAAPRYVSALQVERRGEKEALLTFRAKSLAAEGAPKGVNVLFFLVEREVRAIQFVDRGRDKEYVHRNVFRGVLNSDQVNTQGDYYRLDESRSLRVSLDRKPGDRPRIAPVLDNCDVYAVLVDPRTNQFLDVVKAPLAP